MKKLAILLLTLLSSCCSAKKTTTTETAEATHASATTTEAELASNRLTDLTLTIDSAEILLTHLSPAAPVGPPLFSADLRRAPVLKARRITAKAVIDENNNLTVNAIAIAQEETATSAETTSERRPPLPKVRTMLLILLAVATPTVILFRRLRH